MTTETKYHAWTFFRDGSPAYATDKPGCDGRKKSKINPNCDWGYGKKQNALEMNENECKQFAKYQNNMGRQAFFSPV